ncbi:MAG: Ig-like domain-containing protein, partial [Chloroflexota bacterium]
MYELTQTGQVVATRDLSQFNLRDPQGLVFAPSGDLTDSPAEISLYLTDGGTPDALQTQGGESPQNGQAGPDSVPSSGSRIYLPLILHGADGAEIVPPSPDTSPDTGEVNVAAASAPGQIVELSFTQAAAPAASSFTSSLVQTINAWQWSPPSPDSAGIVYLPASNSLLVSDSEVNEMSIYTGVNLFESTLTGTLIDTFDTTSFSDEPTGVTLNPSNGHLFFSDDTGTPRAIYEMEPGPDGQYDTSDDIITSFSTSDFGSMDPEGVTYDSWQGVLFIADGVNNEIYRVSPGANGIFDGIAPAGDDQVTSFDTEVLGLLDPEGIAFNSDNGNLYAVNKPVDTLFEITTHGFLVQTIDISAANADKPAGLAYAPSSLDPNVMNIYIVDRGVDNNSDPNENDGKIYEMTLPPPPGTNVPPTANNDSATTIEGMPVTIDVAFNDTDSNGNLDPTSANTTCANGSTGCADPVNGTLVNNSDGTFTYTPNPGFTGNDSFVYEICDTEPLCDTAPVNITVSGQQTLYVSSTSGGNVGGVAFADEDILAYDLSTGTWSMYFDGSDVGLNASGQEVDAFYVNADGTILLSLGAAGT